MSIRATVARASNPVARAVCPKHIRVGWLPLDAEPQVNKHHPKRWAIAFFLSSFALFAARRGLEFECRPFPIKGDHRMTTLLKICSAVAACGFATLVASSSVQALTMQE